MSTTTIRDSVDSLKDTARDAYKDLKSATMDRVVDPIREKGRDFVSAARHGAENAAEYGRRGLSRSEAWISSNPFPAAGLAFGAGLVAGAILLNRCRR
jgi:ElaB/YqjD/DUF883 family membrane-anchored ribosome-binding protein